MLLKPYKCRVYRGDNRINAVYVEETLNGGVLLILGRVEQPRRGFMRPGGQNRMASRAFQAAPGGRGGNRNARPRGTRPLRARRTKEELDAELDTMMAHE